MEVKTKQRLVGGLVLLAIAAIFLPLWVHRSSLPTDDTQMVTTPQTPVPSQQVPLQLEVDQAANTPSQSVEVAAHQTPVVTQKILNTTPVSAAASSTGITGNASVTTTAGVTAPAPATTFAAASRAPSSVATAMPSSAAVHAPMTTSRQAIAVAPPSTEASATVTGVASPQSVPNAASTTPLAAPAKSEQTTMPAVSNRSAHVSTLPVQHNQSRVHASQWMVQIAGFAYPHHAAQLVQSLRAKGYDVHTQTQKKGARIMTRVYLGPLTAHEAKRMQQKLRREANLSSVIKRNTQ